MTGFVLDPRLAADGPVLGDLALCRVILRNERRLPWLVLVPRLADLRDLDDLSADADTTLTAEVRAAAQAVRALAATEKLNVASLGAVVAQLHIHVVGRRRDDAFWPAAPFGHAPEAYDADALGAAADRARRAFAAAGQALR